MCNNRRRGLCAQHSLVYTYRKVKVTELRLTLTNNSHRETVPVSIHTHKMLHFPILPNQVSPPVPLGLRRLFQGLLLSCMFTCCDLLLLLALVGQNLSGRESN